MQTTLEEKDKHVVRLQVEIPPEEFAKDLDRTYRKLAQEVRIPGFRKGKVPRQIIDARVGREHVMHQFIDEFLPTYYVQAIREHDLAPIADPEIDVDQAEAGHSLRFTATVEVRPRLTLEPEQYKGIQVDAPDSEPRELEIDEYIDHLRERNAELEVVARPAQKGDYVLADVRAYVHDKEIAPASRVGYFEEIGSEKLVPELDQQLEGKRNGDILKFNAVLPESFGQLAGQEVTFQVLVKEVKSKKLPVADDEFAKTASEFDTMEDLRDDVRTKLRALKEAESAGTVREMVLQKVVDSIEVELPERLVDEETEHRIESARERAERAGTTLEALLESQEWDELRFRSDARAHAVRALKSDLVLEAVAKQEGIKATKEDVEREIRSLAEATGKDAREVVGILERSGQVGSLAGDIIRTKALDLLVEGADVSTGGAPATTEPVPPEDQEGEHD